MLIDSLIREFAAAVKPTVTGLGWGAVVGIITGDLQAAVNVGGFMGFAYHLDGRLRQLDIRLSKVDKSASSSQQPS